MANEKGRNKKKREDKRVRRLRLLLGTDLCACGGGHLLRCNGMCREQHTNQKTGTVECPEVYRIDSSAIKNDGHRKTKRSWKYGRQRENNDDGDKKRRREKWERNRSSSDR